MQAVRLHPAESGAPFSASNPAPASALVLDTIPIPTLAKPGQLLIRVHATTATRGELAWPETYSTALALLGYDLAGTVVAVQDDPNSGKANTGFDFKPGDEVFAMLDMSGGSTWAEYTIAKVDHVGLKPKSLTWAESAAVPISALTAWQALFVQAKVKPPDFSPIAENGSQAKRWREGMRTIAVTGASGAVGTFIVQLAALAGLHVVAVTSSKARDGEFLKSLGARELFEYQDFKKREGQYDIIIDTVGGEILEGCWSLVMDDGTLVSVESSSANFVSQHRQQQLAEGKDGVRALFFIVQPSGENLRDLSLALNLGLLKVFVAHELPLREARAAYELANGRLQRRGKVVLTI
jgi:NADPH:quinone reductase-like Zn-dependent oxidoreductase